MYCLGYKVEIPKKEDVRAWRRLREDCRAIALRAAEEERVTRVRQQHAAERRIAELSALPPNRDRSKTIAALRKIAPEQAPPPTPLKARG